MLFLIAYDIANPRRLKRVARCLEKHAMRRQKSVFIADLSRAELNEVMDEVAQLIEHEEDIVQAWRLSSAQPAEGATRGNVVPLSPSSVVVGAQKQPTFVTREKTWT